MPVRPLLVEHDETLPAFRARVPRHFFPLLNDFQTAWRAINASPGSAGRLHGPPDLADLDEAVDNLAIVWGASRWATMYSCRARTELTADPALAEACYKVARAHGRRIVLAIRLEPPGRFVEDYTPPMGRWD